MKATIIFIFIVVFAVQVKSGQENDATYQMLHTLKTYLELQEQAKDDDLGKLFEILADLRDKMMNLTDSQKVMEKKVEDLQAGVDIVQGSLDEVQQNVRELQQGQQLLFNELLPCEAPARVVLPFGCVFPVKEEKTWSEAQENCERLGKTLLEGISSLKELDELNTHFGTFLFGDFPYGDGAWLGMKDLRWIEGGDPAPPSSSSLWRSGFPSQPGSGKDCGHASFFFHGTSYLEDYTCSRSFSSFCQNKKK